MVCGRDISADEARQTLQDLYNDLALVGHIHSPAQAERYRDVVLHCIAAFHSVSDKPQHQPRQGFGQVLEFPASL